MVGRMFDFGVSLMGLFGRWIFGRGELVVSVMQKNF